MGEKGHLAQLSRKLPESEESLATLNLRQDSLMTELGNQIQEVQRKQNELLLSHIITLLLKDTYLTFFPDIDSDFETGTSKDTKLK